MADCATGAVSTGIMSSEVNWSSESERPKGGQCVSRYHHATRRSDRAGAQPSGCRSTNAKESAERSRHRKQIQHSCSLKAALRYRRGRC